MTMKSDAKFEEKLICGLKNEKPNFLLVARYFRLVNRYFFIQITVK